MPEQRNDPRWKETEGEPEATYIAIPMPSPADPSKYFAGVYLVNGWWVDISLTYCTQDEYGTYIVSADAHRRNACRLLAQPAFGDG